MWKTWEQNLWPLIQIDAMLRLMALSCAQSCTLFQGPINFQEPSWVIPLNCIIISWRLKYFEPCVLQVCSRIDPKAWHSGWLGRQSPGPQMRLF